MLCPLQTGYNLGKIGKRNSENNRDDYQLTYEITSAINNNDSTAKKG